MLATRLRGALTIGALALGLTTLLLGAHAWAQPRSGSLDELLAEGMWLEFNTGLYGLDIQTLAVDPERAARMYAGAEGFLYRSVDGGENWDVVERVAQSGQGRQQVAQTGPLSVIDIDNLTDEQLDAVDDRREELEQELFAEVEEESGEFLAAIAVEEAQDELLEQALQEVLADEPLPEGQGAVEFAPSADLIPDNRFRHVVVDPTEPSRVYAASGRGVLRSTDYGASWEELYRGIGDDERRVSAMVVGPRRMVLATQAGLYVRAWGEARFRRASGPPADAAVRFVVAAPSDPERVYAEAEGRIYLSDDSGESWVPRGVPSGLGPSDFGNMVVAPDERNRLYVATSDGVLVSDDAGNTFERTGYVGLRDRRVTWVTLAEGVLLAGTLDGVFASQDGGDTWRELSRGLSAAQIHQVVATGEGRIWIATNRGIFRLMTPEEVPTGEGPARRAREQWAFDPDLGQTVQAALVYYGYAELPVDAWERRIFWSRFLPRATLRYTVQQRRWTVEDYVPDTLGQPRRTSRRFVTNNDDELRVYFSWDVNQLIMDPREVSERDVHDRVIRRRNSLIRRVIRTYDARRGLLVRIAEGRRMTVTRQVSDQLRLAELTAQLDMYTGGFFTAYGEMARP